MKKMTKASDIKILQPLLASPLRCHLLGGLLSLAFALAIVWILGNADAFAKDDRYTPEQLQRASKLVSDEEKIRDNHAKCELERNQNNLRKNNIKQWIPETIHLETFAQRISKLAEVHNLELMPIDPGKKYAGRRVGIQQVTCEVQGSYQSLCRLIHQLCEEHATWCDSVKINRAPHNNVECLALLSLRLPYAAPGSLAAELYPKEAEQKKEQDDAE